ncbi:MAG: TIGR03905 family TSCPD domain-containing protein [Planctomycetia bacterium]|nr:TIGR03905 family TSCPD domain-containing protein [Planctomycetia bacterium]
MQHTYKTNGTCSSAIQFDLNGDKVTNVRFFGGCPGNLTAIARLVNGKSVDEIESQLKGITCGGKPTSCSDQLARAVRQAYGSRSQS